VVSAAVEFALDGDKTYLSFTIDCFNGWLVCWKVSMHPDCELPVSMLEDLVGKIKAL
jgi:putative transposase